MAEYSYPLRSLQEGHWFKLICGASFQHLPAIRNLTLAYALAGADCIDVAADPAVLVAVHEALQVVADLRNAAPSSHPVSSVSSLPFVMMSLSDGEDPHFRKVRFNPDRCPIECSRPCETICPAHAIVFDPRSKGFSGVIDQRCYGCGRCVTVCPIAQIEAYSYGAPPEEVLPIAFEMGIDAIEIHTQVGRVQEFQNLWHQIHPWVDHLKLLAISCPDGEGLIDYLQVLYATVQPLPCPLIWQTDGRSMSGDIGSGTTHAAIKLGQKVLAAQLPGFVQLAGGTNAYTVTKLRSLELLQPEASPSQAIAGVAYGSYARVLLSPILERLEMVSSMSPLETFPPLLQEAVALAHNLIAPLKPRRSVIPSPAIHHF